MGGGVPLFGIGYDRGMPFFGENVFLGDGALQPLCFAPILVVYPSHGIFHPVYKERSVLFFCSQDQLFGRGF